MTDGELAYPSILAAIAATGVGGYVGLEYWPRDDPGAGLNAAAGWFK